MTIKRASLRRMVGWCLACAIAVGWATAGALGADAFPPATPESQGVSSAAVRRLAEEVEGYVRDGTIVGGELLVIKNRRTILHEAYGLRDREDGRPMEPGTIFNIRSMTKPLTGVAVQMLADEGKLSLDDPVAKYLPGFDNDRSRAITIAHLLEHRSGLPLMRMDAHDDLAARAEAIGRQGPQFGVGEKFWYSDLGSDTAAAVVEKVSGMTIDRFVAERILKPLGMDDSFYLTQASAGGDDPRLARLATLYVGTPGKWTRFSTPEGRVVYPYAWGSQSLYATTADYARFLALWMDGGVVGGDRLLSEEAIARILTLTSPMKSLGSDGPYPCGFFGMKPHYGQMSMLYAAGQNPARGDVRVFGHGGSDGTAAWAFPEQDLIVCYFTQSRGQPTPIRLETTIQDALVMPEGGGEAPAEMQALLGSYRADFPPLNSEPFQVVYRCGKLAVDIPGQLVFELAEPDATGRRQFVFTEALAVSFRKDDQGNVTTLLLHRGERTFELPRAKPTPASE